jgi:hypothetical protein
MAEINTELSAVWSKSKNREWQNRISDMAQHVGAIVRRAAKKRVWKGMYFIDILISTLHITNSTFPIFFTVPTQYQDAPYDAPPMDRLADPTHPKYKPAYRSREFVASPTKKSDKVADKRKHSDVRDGKSFASVASTDRADEPSQKRPKSSTSKGNVDKITALVRLPKIPKIGKHTLIFCSY